MHVFFFLLGFSDPVTLGAVDSLVCLSVWLVGFGLVWFGWLVVVLENGAVIFRLEILPWCELPAHLPAGTLVKATQHLLSPCAIIVQAGTKGTILGGVDSSLAFVSFGSQGPAVAAAMNTLEISDEKLESEVGWGIFRYCDGVGLWLGIK